MIRTSRDRLNQIDVNHTQLQARSLIARHTENEAPLDGYNLGVHSHLRQEAESLRDLMATTADEGNTTIYRALSKRLEYLERASTRIVNDI